jgi:hypothetical protein
LSVVSVRAGVRVVSSPPWPEGRMFAFCVDGVVLVNARALDDVDMAELSKKEDTFVGVPLTASEVRRLRVHLRDASSEAAAVVAAKRLKRSRQKT